MRSGLAGAPHAARSRLPAPTVSSSTKERVPSKLRTFWRVKAFKALTQVNRLEANELFQPSGETPHGGSATS